jgi:hypothetical protein
MKTTKTLLLILISIIFSCKNEDTHIKIIEIQVEAPFEMPTIKVPDFSNCKSFLITDFGAIQGDKELTSKAISKAIDEANKIGGGIVIIPKGEWLTKKIHFKSHVNLHLNKDAILLFSENPKDYLPAVHTTWEGMECYNYSPLIYAYQCKNIAITGEGKLKAKMCRRLARLFVHDLGYLVREVVIPHVRLAPESLAIDPHHVATRVVIDHGLPGLAVFCAAQE